MTGGMKVLQPPGWPRPMGYSNGIAASGRTIWTAGVIGWDETETLVSDTLVGQFEQILRNTLAILAEAGAGPEHVVRMTWYVTDRDEYVASLKDIGAAWRAHMGRNYPTMAVVAVSALVEPGAKIEIETTAVVPE
jgi:enamine deaminase RidA (YjgF/YER057c/UK114 family)